MATRIYKQGVVTYGKRRIEYKVAGGMTMRHAQLSMREEGKRNWEKMAIVHPSIYATAIRQFAADYVRWHKRR